MKPPSTFESLLIRACGSIMAGRGNSAALLVMIYHRVLVQPDPLLPSEPDAATFASHMDLLARHFNALPLTEAVGRLRAGTLPARAVCVTFDDGYANNCEVALPILAARGIPATVFVAPGFLNGGRMFNDTIIEAVRRAPAELDLRGYDLGYFQLTDAAARIRAFEAIITKLKYRAPRDRVSMANAVAEQVNARLPDDLMMSDAQVRQLHRSGIEIGAHTMTHPILRTVDVETARSEIIDSRRRLEEMLDAPVKSFAYPNGRPGADYAATHVALAREAGYDFAVSTAWGAATIRSDLFQIPRVAPWDLTARSFAGRLVRAYRQRRVAYAHPEPIG